jgi:hypothetical protein
MRLIKRDQRLVTFRERKTLKEPDGTTYEGWDPNGIAVKANVQPASGRVMAEQYGERLGYILVAYMEGHPDIKESSGAWVYVPSDAEKPDYRVVAVRKWRHTVVEMEKMTP